MTKIEKKLYETEEVVNGILEAGEEPKSDELEEEKARLYKILKNEDSKEKTEFAKIENFFLRHDEMWGDIGEEYDKTSDGSYISRIKEEENLPILKELEGYIKNYREHRKKCLGIHDAIKAIDRTLDPTIY
ncbi:hypothetical protein LQZ18_16695 [Lachnospiraceae bacterium ZAX-1]